MASPSTTSTGLANLVSEPVRRTRTDGWMLTGIAIAILTTVAGIMSTGVSLRYFFQPTAAWIVLGGTLGVTLVTTPRNSLLHAARRVIGLVRQPTTNRQELKNELISYVKTARIQGVLAIEPRIKQASNGFLRE
ncbi:MAG: motility-associated protein, partial [Bryobacteraceae bacterium]